MRSVGVAVVAVLMVLQTAMQTEAKGICPMYKCGGNCVTRYGANGCPNGCDCGPSCQDTQCDPGTVCEYHTVQCFTQPCYPQPTCVALCPPQDPCGIRCMYGLKTDENGCQLCQCQEPPSS